MKEKELFSPTTPDAAFQTYLSWFLKASKDAGFDLTKFSDDEVKTIAANLMVRLFSTLETKSFGDLFDDEISELYEVMTARGAYQEQSESLN